eukprot:gnl/MRDRNA2_/MRDRNA2_90733_c0_seq1.p1 gnl/MRDRNA2_/MRDRNA2_90733_c0~~gnl/MRDRNA2_/MRDRNA2_90733_c0_seq1.p1  ORF type:complete len:278 (-),score=69.74 gnl/MRDRNA2_/MRDRNA2_90733_c0_seq1:12-845(-)
MLTEEQHIKVEQILAECGGQVSGGIVSTRIPGIKLADLKESFETHWTGKDFFVLSPGQEFNPSNVRTPSHAPKGRGKKRSDPWGFPGGQAWPFPFPFNAFMAGYHGGFNGGWRGHGQGSAKKQKFNSGGPVAPLDPEQVEAVRAMIHEHGGQIGSGLATTLMPGLKKAQLAEHFSVEVINDGEYILSESGTGAERESALAVTTQKKTKTKQWVRSTEPPAPLEEEKVEEVSRLIQENGGEIALGKLTTILSGIKKAQLEPLFKVEQISSGNYSVKEL